MVARLQPGGRMRAVADGRRFRSLSSNVRPSRTLPVVMAVTIVVLWSAASARAAAGETAWTKRWNADAGTVAAGKAVARTGGGLYVAATVVRPPGNVDIVVLRLSAAGKRLWTRSYDGAGHGLDWMKDAVATRDGGVVVCGSSFGSRGGQDWAVVKYAPDGTRRWVRKVAGSYGGPDVPEALAVDAKGALVVAGTLTRRATGGDWCLVKYAADGALLWRTTLTRSVRGLDQPLALAVDDADGHIYVTGRVYSSRSGDDVATVSYRPDGRRVWRRFWDGDAHGQDRGADIAVSAAGVAVAGVTQSPETGDDGLVLRYRKNGSLRWARTVDGGQGTSAGDAFAAVAIDDGGDVVAGGTLATDAAHGEDAAVVRCSTDNAESARWQVAGAGADEAVLDLVAPPRGRVYVAGRMTAGSDPAALVAGLSRSLAPLWPIVTYDRAGTVDEAQSIAMTAGALYVAGVSGPDLFVARILR